MITFPEFEFSSRGLRTLHHRIHQARGAIGLRR
jgi:hypothetical protein